MIPELIASTGERVSQLSGVLYRAVVKAAVRDQPLRILSLWMAGVTPVAVVLLITALR